MGVLGHSPQIMGINVTRAELQCGVSWSQGLYAHTPHPTVHL